MAVISINDELTWGGKLATIYERSKRHFGVDEVGMEACAERISKIVPVVATTLGRLRDYDEKPTNAGTRQVAWLFVTALGADPAELDLTVEDLRLECCTTTRIMKLVAPKSLCFSGDGRDAVLLPAS